MNSFYQELVDDVDALSALDEPDFTRLPGDLAFPRPTVADITLKAALISCNQFCDWLPKSQMRVDSEGYLYLANWLYKKHFVE